MLSNCFELETIWLVDRRAALILDGLVLPEGGLIAAESSS